MTDSQKEQHFCVTLYIFNKEGSKTLLIKHKKLGWYLPAGGHIESNEDYINALKREAQEELGISDFELPNYLHPYKFNACQPILIQRNQIKDGHTHDDLIFAGIIDESLTFNPMDGESTDIQWFSVDDVLNVYTSEEVKLNVDNISAKIQQKNKEKLIKENIYFHPRYNQKLSNELSNFISGESFNDWNLGDIYTDIPNKYANKLGAKYGIFCSTGTAGLHASLIALGLKPGDEVVVPSMTFVRAVTPLNHLQLQPVIADIDSKTGNISPESIKQVITAKTKAVIVVHMWGVPADCEAIRSICDEHGLKMIEDFSHAHYSKFKDKFVGSFGDVAFASLQRKKTLSVGEGGLIVTSDEAVFSKLKEITSPGSFDITKNYADVDFSGFGLNMRMSPFSAVVAKNIYQDIDKIVSGRAKSIEILTKIIADNTDKIRLSSIPEYTNLKSISWYSYKPVLNGSITLDQLKELKFWKFGDFGYSAISSHKYWLKDTNYFPFNYGIKPVITTTLEGHDEYMKNRISLNIPSVDESYWSEDVVNNWVSEIKKI